MHIEPACEPCGCAHSRDFLAGFIGPRVLGPDSNIGPIIGLLFSGPAGAGLGAPACVLSWLCPRPFGPAVLRGMAVLPALVTLYYFLPGPSAGRLAATDPAERRGLRRRGGHPGDRTPPCHLRATPPIGPTTIWPLVDASGFLMLQQIRPVPVSNRSVLN